MQFKIINSREDFLEKFVEQNTETIVKCYSDPWEKYCNFCNSMTGSVKITDQFSPLLLKFVTPSPFDLLDKLTDAEKEEYCVWLFKSILLQNHDNTVKVGDKITYHLPISFKCYINDNRRERLSNEDIPMEERIKDFKSIVDLVVNKLNETTEQNGFAVEADIASAVAPESGNKFEYFTLNVKQTREFTAEENALVNGDQVSTIDNLAEHGIVENIPAKYSNSKEDLVTIVTGVTIAVAILWWIICVIVGVVERKKFLKFIKECVSNKDIGIINDFLMNVKKDFIEMGKKYSDGAKKIIGKENILPYFADFFKKYVDDTTVLNASYEMARRNINVDDDKIVLYAPCVLGFEISASDMYAEDEDGCYTYDESAAVPKLRKYVREFVKSNFVKNKLQKSKSTLDVSLSDVWYGDDHNYWVGSTPSYITFPDNIKTVIKEIIAKWNEMEGKK